MSCLSLLLKDHCQNLRTTSRSGAAENSSDTQQFRRESEHLIVHSRNLETEKVGCQSAVRSLDMLRKFFG